MDFFKQNVSSSQTSTIERKIWLYAWHNGQEIKRELRRILSEDLILLRMTALDILGQTLNHDKELAIHLTMNDFIVIVGGFDGYTLNTHQSNIQHFCETVTNTNIMLCDETFDQGMKSLSLRNPNVTCVDYRTSLSGNNISAYSLCQLLSRKIIRQNTAAAANRPNVPRQSQPSTSTGRVNDYLSPQPSTSNNAFGNFGAFTSGGAGDFNFPRQPNAKKKRTDFDYASALSSKNKLNVVHQNINGLLTKQDKIIRKINEMANQNVDIDVICLTETNMVDEDVDVVDIPNFEPVKSIIRDTRKGGCCILLREDLRFRILPKIEESNGQDLMECCAVKLVDLDIIIICIYRPPRSLRDDLDDFFDELELTLKRYKKNKLIICGDFNIDLLKNDKRAKDFKDLIREFNLIFAINTVTRYETQTCIDNIIHNFHGSPSRVLNWRLSDHNAQLLSVSLEQRGNFKAGNNSNANNIMNYNQSFFGHNNW